MEEKDFFEDFTTLKWVKWTKRTPTFNGSVYVRWNGKYTSHGRVHNGILASLEGEQTKTSKKDGVLVAEYTDSQKEILENLYWLEETHDLEAFEKYQNNL